MSSSAAVCPERVTILWLTGWSMPVTIFSRLQALLPGFQHLNVDYSAVDTPEEMIALIEYAAARCNGRVMLGGWSLGALLALQLATYRSVEGLLIFSGTASFVRPNEQRDKGWPNAYVRQMIAALRKDRPAVEASFRKTLFTASERESGAEELLPEVGSWTTSALIAGLHLLRSRECLARLSLIRCPVFLVHGFEDSVCPSGAADELHDWLPQAKLMMLEGCGHVPFLGREAVMAEVIRRWWDEQQPYSTPI